MESSQSYSIHDRATSRPGHASTGMTSGFWWSRVVLRVLSMICSAAAIGVSAYYNEQWSIGLLLLMGPPAGLSLAWSCIDIVALSIPQRGGPHPVACVILDLLLFLGLASVAGYLGFVNAKVSDSGYYFAFFGYASGEDYLRITLGFGFMCSIFHLALLILAVLQLHRRRRNEATLHDFPTQPNSGMSMGDTGVGEAPPAYSPQRLDSVDHITFVESRVAQRDKITEKSPPSFP